ncbi:hypothetical protein BAE44_0025090, partial [Dichanthelium oligosanthes]
LTYLSQHILHCLLVCVCNDGHLYRSSCWNGCFTLSDVLILLDGHVRINPSIIKEGYTPARGEANYLSLYDIVITFVDVAASRYPVHLQHLLYLLRNADNQLRVKPEFVIFLINHSCLLTYAEKRKLYDVVDKFFWNPTG